MENQEKPLMPDELQQQPGNGGLDDSEQSHTLLIEADQLAYTEEGEGQEIENGAKVDH